MYRFSKLNLILLLTILLLLLPLLYLPSLGSLVRTSLLHLALSCASSSVAPTAVISSLMQSFHLLLGHPLFLRPTVIILTLLPMYPFSQRSTCPNHFSLHSLSLFAISSAPMVSLMVPFCILSILVFPRVNRSIFISGTSIFLSCPFVTATVSIPYNVVHYCLW